MKIWVAITSHSPTGRLHYLKHILTNYKNTECDVIVNIFCDAEAQNEHSLISESLEDSKVNFNLIYADKSWDGYRLTWAHKEMMKSAIKNKEADLYIYQEDDIDLQKQHIDYYWGWRPFLKNYGLTPGFTRYEYWNGEQIPFDNQDIHPLDGATRKIWGDVAFPVKTFFIANPEVLCFSQLQNPYYGAMILDQEEAEEYIESFSFKERESAAVVGYRCWPIADRASMGTAFNNVPNGLQHKRAIAVTADLKIDDACLIQHFGSKYSKALSDANQAILNYREIFTLNNNGAKTCK